jgi:hypothetical protein
MKKCAYEPKERIRTLFQARSLQSDLADDPCEMLVFDVSPRSDKSVRTIGPEPAHSHLSNSHTHGATIKMSTACEAIYQKAKEH